MIQIPKETAETLAWAAEMYQTHWRILDPPTEDTKYKGEAAVCARMNGIADRLQDAAKTVREALALAGKGA